jgi:hypothetical protein
MQISEQQWAELYETTPFGKYFRVLPASMREFTSSLPVG